MGEVRNIKLNLNIKNQNSGKLTVGPAVVEENVGVIRNRVIISYNYLNSIVCNVCTP